MRRYLFDTNTVSALMQAESPLYARVRALRRAGDLAVLSPVVEYEIHRGLLRNKSQRLAERFERAKRHFEYVELDRATWCRAAELWAHSRDKASPFTDADIIIAAQSFILDAVLVTNNERHFRLFEPLGLKIENWVLSAQ